MLRTRAQKGGYDTLKLIKAKPRTPATELQLRRSKVTINPNSGHWVMFGVEGFNRLIRRELQDALEDLPASSSE